MACDGERRRQAGAFDSVKCDETVDAMIPRAVKDKVRRWFAVS
jgi:hypothetical protein